MLKRILIFAVLALPGCAPAQSAPVACTDEGKICPDGSAVGRTGPHCEFTPCPTSAPRAAPNCNMGPVTCPDGSKVLCKPCPGPHG